ncbi:ABC transporter substrate-binding protein [Martelella mangrovi]|uniref:Peptide/nickel transport system substrate-binding protein n=1 Tax=Martelella mangrovi TaxID=1397477 RepID=A0ABV2IBW7_9HYPH
MNGIPRLLTAAFLAGGSALPALAATPDDALVMAWNIDAISTFDPAQVGEVVTNELLQNTCDALVSFKPEAEAEVIPALAESWTVSEDGKTITFNLHQDAVFPSGNPVTAEDFVWSLKRAISLGYGNAAALTDYGFSVDNMDERITAPDDYTLVLKFGDVYPSSLLMQAIAANRVSIALDKELIMQNEQDGDFGNAYLKDKTACAGPYHLASWNQGQGVLLEANDNYYGEKPGLSRVMIRHVAETGTQRLMVEKGDVDIARDLTPEDLRELEAMDGIHVTSALKPQLIFWTFNTADEIFSHQKVRLAMKYLIDYDALGDTVMQYLGKPWNSFAQSGAFGALPEDEARPFHLDLDKAKELITEAGYPDGFEATILVGSLPWSAPLGQHVQQNAAQIGVELNIEQMANAQFFARVRGREYQSGIKAWQTGVPDAHGNASRLVMNPDNSFEAQLTQYPAWRASYQDPEYNAIVEAAAVETDPEKRKAMYADLQKRWMETGEMAIMFQTYFVAAARDTLKNWTWNGFQVYYDMASK